MSTYFSINESLNIGLNNGTAYCILEETRAYFDGTFSDCLNDIYEGYDIGMTLVIFNEASSECYNYFYQKCEIAMKHFPDSEHADGMAPNLIAGIMLKWGELLETLRKDPRYKVD
ncbi:TPA: hypothetical protein SML50_000691 [Serratia fonticola]|nr:hypothetical protein [Serratia fonticola]